MQLTMVGLIASLFRTDDRQAHVGFVGGQLLAGRAKRHGGAEGAL